MVMIRAFPVAQGGIKCAYAYLNNWHIKVLKSIMWLKLRYVYKINLIHSGLTETCPVVHVTARHS